MSYISSKRGQRGNVLFLILLAVALFAALSYAVTQSNRSGGSDAGSETDAVNAATITQYPTGIRTAILRMTVDGTAVNTLEFNPPSDFGNCSTPTGGVAGELCVFHPSGGGATHQQSPASAMANVAPGDWTVNMDFEIPQVGTTTAASLNGNELIAFLPGLTYSMCVELNKRYNVHSSADYAPPLIGVDLSGTSPGDYGLLMDNANAPDGTDIDLDNGDNDLTAQPYGCFENGTSASATLTGTYVYYHTLVER